MFAILTATAWERDIIVRTRAIPLPSGIASELWEVFWQAFSTLRGHEYTKTMVRRKSRDSRIRRTTVQACAVGMADSFGLDRDKGSYATPSFLHVATICFRVLFTIIVLAPSACWNEFREALRCGI
jgi:hypothetical protein